MKDRIVSVFYKLAVIFFAIIFLYVFLLNILYGFKKGNFISPLLCLGFITGYLFLFCKLKKKEFKYSQALKWILLIVAFILLVILGYQTRVGLYDTWDFGGLIRCSYENAHGGRSEAWYFARYPNNIPLLVFETILCKFVLFFYKDLTLGAFRGITILVNAIIIFSGMLLLHRIIKKTIGNEAASLSVGILLFFCPFYLFCAMLYTDTVSMLLSLLAFFCFYIYDNTTNQKKKVISFVSMVILIYLGFKFKATNIFLWIALIMEFIYESKWKEILFSFLILVIISFPINYGIDVGFKVTPEERELYEFPHTHWVMMALNPKTQGGYIWDDVFYTESFKTYESRKEANIAKIKERIKDYGPKKLLYRILVTKNIRTWADPTLITNDYLNRHPVNNNIFTNTFTSPGKYYPIYNYYITAVYLFILFGAVLSSYFNFQEKNKFVFLSQMMLVGIFLFELVWECNSRYLYNFFPFLVISTCYGYTKLLEKVKEKMKNSKSQEVS